MARKSPSGRYHSPDLSSSSAFLITFGKQLNGALLPPTGKECGPTLSQNKYFFKMLCFLFCLSSFRSAWPGEEGSTPSGQGKWLHSPPSCKSVVFFCGFFGTKCQITCQINHESPHCTVIRCKVSKATKSKVTKKGLGCGDSCWDRLGRHLVSKDQSKAWSSSSLTCVLNVCCASEFWAAESFLWRWFALSLLSAQVFLLLSSLFLLCEEQKSSESERLKLWAHTGHLIGSGLSLLHLDWLFQTPRVPSRWKRRLIDRKRQCVRWFKLKWTCRCRFRENVSRLKSWKLSRAGGALWLVYWFFSLCLASLFLFSTSLKLFDILFLCQLLSLLLPPVSFPASLWEPVWPFMCRQLAAWPSIIICSH